jgi:hypothetical protein
MFSDGIKYKCRLCWRFIIGVSDRQQAPPHLTFASPWAKPNLVMDQELLQLNIKSTQVFNQKFSSKLE